MGLFRLLARMTIGLLFVGHGTQKLFGWFGGGGPEGTGQFFEQVSLRPGRRHALAAGTAEAGGGLLFALGAGTPLAASAIGPSPPRRRRRRVGDHTGRRRRLSGRRGASRRSGDGYCRVVAEDAPAAPSTSRQPAPVRTTRPRSTFTRASASASSQTARRGH